MDENQARFQERIQRMEQAGAGVQKQQDEALQMARHQEAVANRKKMQAVVVLMIGLLIVAGAVAVTLKGDGEDDTEVAAAFTPPSSEGNTMFSVRPMREYREKLSHERWIDIVGTGRVYHTPMTLVSDATDATEATEVSISALVSGYQRPDAQTALGALTMGGRTETCTVRPPEGNEKVVGVRLGGTGGNSAPLYGFSDSDLAASLQASVKSATRSPDRFDGFQPVDGEFRVVDVLITDTSAPLYLVLQTTADIALWNLQLAEGVSLVHVVMISKKASALVGAPAGIGIEALRSADFIDSDNDPRRANDQPRECMIVPWRQPQEDWRASWLGKRYGGADLITVKTHEKGFAAYNAWYSAAFGVDANANTLTAESVSHVLLGPRPATPLPYRSVNGQPVWVSPIDNIFQGDEATRQAGVGQLHEAVLQAAIGGDVAMLWPDAVERRAP